MHIRALIRVVVPLVVVALASAQEPPRPAAQAPDYSKEAYVLEQVRSVYRFENDGTGRRERYMRVKTQSEAGVQMFGQLVFGYNAANERLDVQFVRVHKSD